MACVKSCGLAWHEAANGNRLTLPASHPSEAQRAMWQPVVLPGHGSVLYRASPSLVSRRPAARGIRCAAGEANSPKLVTFVGKGGAGKTIAALLAAQYYASRGLRTCLVVQTQDPTADILLGQKLGHKPVSFGNGALTALRLESTKMLLEPLALVKQADAELNFSQRALDEVVGEELTVLPGMDPYLALGALERLTTFSGGIVKTFGNIEAVKYDVVVYDGMSSDESLRMFGLADNARYYLRLIRSVAERTDAGKIVLPSVLRLLEAAFFQGRSGESEIRSTSEIWDAADRLLGRVADRYSDPAKFSCFLLMNSSSQITTEAALRYWGCAVQSGVSVAGVLHPSTPAPDSVKRQFSPLTVSGLPNISIDYPNWSDALNRMSSETKLLLDGRARVSPPPVTFDRQARTVTLFLPGFQKSEVKLSQWRGGSELLIEIGDQRRIIVLPPDIRGKVAGAKFLDKTLVVTIRSR